MATWQNTSLIMLRTMLNDAGCDSVRYTPQRLEDLLITAAYLLPLEINFQNDYVVDVELRTITPDPINPTKQEDGDEFVNLFVDKTKKLRKEEEALYNEMVKLGKIQSVEQLEGTEVEASAYEELVKQIQKKVKELSKTESPKSVTNALFVGSTNDLQRLLKAKDE